MRLLLLLLAPTLAIADGYTVILSKATRADAAWAAVADALVARHPGARILTCDKEPADQLAALRTAAPRWICWVAKPEELGTKPVAAMHMVARALDDDPYTDAFWGVITGHDAAAALAVANHNDPLVIRNVIGGTTFAMDCVEQGQAFSEREQGVIWTKSKGGKPEKSQGEADSTASLARAFTSGKPDAILTSGHATQDDWQPGYSYRNGAFTHRDGTVIGKALDGSVHEIISPNPKVYLGIGNCLIADVPGKPECMATAWMNTGGVKQFVGYTVPTWFGYAGWGVLDYFIEQPGRFSLTEAVFANHHALTWKLTVATGTPDADKRGLAHDRDVLVLHGDPAWDARLAPGPLRWTEEFSESAPGIFTWSITPAAGDQTFATVDINGSQRGGRPLVRFLPRRFASVTLLDGAEWKPVLADDFILLPRPATVPAKITLRVRATP